LPICFLDIYRPAFIMLRAVIDARGFRQKGLCVDLRLQEFNGDTFCRGNIDLRCGVHGFPRCCRGAGEQCQGNAGTKRYEFHLHYMVSWSFGICRRPIDILPPQRVLCQLRGALHLFYRVKVLRASVRSPVLSCRSATPFGIFPSLQERRYVPTGSTALARFLTSAPDKPYMAKWTSVVLSSV
jgi:hypothetical protein